ncbi:MAG: DUF2490 domain-containing protein [Bacteroidota bacterium]
MRKAALAILIAATLPSVTFSQSHPTDKVSQAIEWFSLSNNIKVHKRLSFLVEGQFRFAGQFQPMQFQFRTGADIHITKNFSVMPLGYVYTWNPTYGKQPAQYVNNEHRFYQQVFYKHHAGKFHFSHRGRLEERHIQVHTMENGEVINEGYDRYLTRFRYRLMVNVPFKGTEIAPKTTFASFYNETFIEWGKGVVHRAPDQNRLFAGVGYQASKKFTMTGGFLYHMLVKLNGVQQENNFGFQVNATYNFDLTNQ